MTIYEFNKVDSHEDNLLIVANDAQDARVFIANHNNLEFNDWKLHGLLSKSNEISIQYPYIISNELYIKFKRI